MSGGPACRPSTTTPWCGARDWLALSWRKAALGLGWSWAITLPEEQGAVLVGVISLHWNGELAWWVGVPWQNRGLATRAATGARAAFLSLTVIVTTLPTCLTTVS